MVLRPSSSSKNRPNNNKGAHISQHVPFFSYALTFFVPSLVSLSTTTKRSRNPTRECRKRRRLQRSHQSRRRRQRPTKRNRETRTNNGMPTRTTSSKAKAKVPRRVTSSLKSRVWKPSSRKSPRIGTTRNWSATKRWRFGRFRNARCVEANPSGENTSEHSKRSKPMRIRASER